MIHLPSLRSIAAALGGDVIDNKYVSAPGPGHSNKDRSLSVTPDASAPDGFLVHSFAGDDDMECKDYVRKRLGMGEWKPNGGAKNPCPEHVYYDEKGARYLRVLRIDKPDGQKIYPQYHWTGTAWAKGKPKGPKIPYRLAELIKADEVFVVEGEKCADRLAAIKLVATTASEGAGKWKPELNRWFAGKTVYVLPDNDKPGIKHAAEVAKNLGGVARDVRVVPLPGLPDKGDVVDWLDSGGGAAKLITLCRDAPPPPDETADPVFVLDSKNVNPSPTRQDNIRLAMKALKVRVRYDKFGDRSVIEGLEGFELLDDRAMDRLWLLIDERFKFRPAKDFFWTVVSDEARRNSFHPVREYLDNLTWDGIKRIDTWLIDCAKAKDTPYVRAVCALMLIAAVRRVRKPGCKFDEMVVLLSKQGENKSTALAIIAVNPNWFSDDLPLGADSKKNIERLKGHWIVEAAELTGMSKSTVEHLKAFLSRSVDVARMSYDRTNTEAPRQCIVVGTTNQDKFLRDQTGNRRFWPVELGAFDLSKLRQDRDQLWAEAAAREEQGESIRLRSELWADAAVEQGERTIEEPWSEVIHGYLGDMEGKILAADVWKLVGMADAQMRTQSHNERLGTAMTANGWEHRKARFGGPPQNCYVKRSGSGAMRIFVDYDWKTRTAHVSHAEAQEPAQADYDSLL